MGFCLPKKETEIFIGALRDGKVDPFALSQMSSAARHTFFTDLLGQKNAFEVNALFESKMLLKNQQAGMVRWAKSIGGLTEKARQDILAKVQKMEKALDATTEQAFLEDLASKKLGADVTFEEANTIVQLAKTTAEKKAAIREDSPRGSPERIEYGTSYVLLQDFVNGLKGKAKQLTAKEWLTSPLKILEDIAGVTKSLVASLDNSFVGRQGIKMLYTHPTIWTKAFLKTWVDMAKELAGVDASLALKAEIVSRPNALNGKYEAGKYDLGVISEEAFPSSLPERVPILGRLYKASQSAFNGAALRMRADYADYLIEKAERFGVDTLNKEQAIGLGRIANSMTGRGHVPLTEGQGRFVNVTVFSIRFLKSNIDTLTAHMFDSKVSRFAKREAAINLVKIIGTTATILAIADQLWPGSVEWDSRSADFGKIRIGSTRFDITGGMGSIVVLSSRLVQGSSKSSATGKVTDLGSDKFGSLNRWDVLQNYADGKLSPIAGSARDYFKNKDFQGNKPTVPSSILNLVTPISFSTFQDLQKNPKAADLLSSMILESLGISANTY